jgi:hypothetical protein
MALTEPWDFAAPVTGNMRLYAAYEEAEPPQGLSIAVDGKPIPGFAAGTYGYALGYRAAQAASPAVTASVAAPGYSVEVAYPEAGVPGAARVTVTGPEARFVYAIRFGVMALQPLAATPSGDGWWIGAAVELSDGVTGYNLVYAVHGADGRIKSVGWEAIGPVEWGGSGQVGAVVSLDIGETDYLRAYLWDEGYAPLLPAFAPPQGPLAAGAAG